MSFAARIKKLFRPSRVIVLMYHRIAEPKMDPWQLAVSKQNFREHLEVLANTHSVISTSELIDRVGNKDLQSDCFCITSDDGYRDNFLNAFPLVEKYGCPSTFFIASGSIGIEEPYWWDVMTDIFLSTKRLPATLDININNKPFSYKLENNGTIDAQQLQKHAAWYWPLTPPTQRCEIYLELWMYLRDQPSATINTAIRELKNWSGVNVVDEDGNFAMSRQELLDMASGKYTDTGVHTITHAALGTFSKQEQEREISGCKDFLDSYLNKKHTSIAFPYGNYNSDTLEVVKKCTLKGAFTTKPEPVTIKSDVYQMGRFQVTNQTGMQFKRQLDNWLNN